jgi:hypothetical protein
MTKNTEQLRDAYLALRLRIKNFAALTLICDEFSSAHRVLENPMALEHGDFAEVLRDLWIGYFASLVDTTKGATNALTLWKALFPKKLQRINEWQHKWKPCLKIIRDYRNERSFHATESVFQQIVRWREYNIAQRYIAEMKREFLNIAMEIFAEEDLESFATRLDACSKRLNQELPGADFDSEFLARYIFGPGCIDTRA